MQRYFYYIDESGDPSLKNINEAFPVFTLCGVLMHAYTNNALHDRVALLKKSFFETDNVILHSTDIRKCEGVFAKLFDLKIKEDFYRELNRVMQATEYSVVAATIDKYEHVKIYGKLADDPYEIALTFLMERIVLITPSDGHITIVIESRGKKEDAILARRYSEIYDRGTFAVSKEEVQKKLPSKMIFKRKSENSVGLQLADLCAYPIARATLYKNEKYLPYEIVSKKFATHGYVMLPNTQKAQNASVPIVDRGHPGP